MRECLKILSKAVKYRVPYWYRAQNYSLHFKSPWNIIFFGTDDFALASLRMIYSEMKSSPQLVGNLQVVCAHYKCSVAKFSKQNNLPVIKWKPSVEDIVKNQAHLGLVASFGHLIPSQIISAFPMGMLNVHASLLPRWRGAAPVVHAVMNKDTLTGVTIMKIRPHRFDEGEILQSASCKIGCEETAEQLTTRLALLGARELQTCLHSLPDCLERAHLQPKEGVTLAPKITPSMAACIWPQHTASHLEACHRALQHLFPLHARWQHKTVRLLGCKEDTSRLGNPGDLSFDWKQRKLLVICCDNSTLSVSHIRLPGKHAISALDFLNGYMKKMPKHEWRFQSGDQDN